MDSTGTHSFKIASTSRSSPIRWLILGGILLISAIAIGATLMASNFRERALRNSDRTQVLGARPVAEHVPPGS